MESPVRDERQENVAKASTKSPEVVEETTTKASKASPKSKSSASSAKKSSKKAPAKSTKKPTTKTTAKAESAQSAPKKVDVLVEDDDLDDLDEEDILDQEVVESDLNGNVEEAIDVKEEVSLDDEDLLDGIPEEELKATVEIAVPKVGGKSKTTRTRARKHTSDTSVTLLTGDPVRMYLKEIGKVNLLTAAEEIDLAMKIEAGVAATEELEKAEDEGLNLTS